MQMGTLECLVFEDFTKREILSCKVRGSDQVVQAITSDINTCQVENVTPDPGIRPCFMFPFLCFGLTES